MGFTGYSDEAAEARVESRVREGKAAVSSYTADIAAGVAPPKVHNDLDPKGLIFRESRDSEAHPESVPVILVLDETGQLPEMLGRAARQLSTEVQRRSMAAATLLEPLLIVAMGAIVLLIVLAVLLPIIQLNTWVK